MTFQLAKTVCGNFAAGGCEAWTTAFRRMFCKRRETFFGSGRRRLDMFAPTRIVPTRMQPNSPTRALKTFGRASRINSRGFTMMELLVVLAILALLATLTITSVGSSLGNAQTATAKLFVNTTLKNPLFQYRVSMSDYPSTADGLKVLIDKPAAKAESWQGPYLDGKLPADPWGEPYQYRYPGVKNKTGYDVWSKGADKIDGTADDIGNWDTEVAPAAK